ncbi:TPA: SAM-dependent methyltransferase TehB [Legionella pneumophila subsp. pneumophila]|uniref:SAM-dependent methyltransferase TehB n=1 Tax=Legionella pneumophila (strain Lens) TaxID=297245 RepID=Q5WTR8_LEGPL|nr:SAM-dependent methyltransferase TehB [Legionella pneumophila]AOW50991.1 SAM-dependent methyltransferase TehB [Legionella pneumophila subsp. pneumophila]AOW55407.1 SAM-dependent methyltransferase TehB [Legionella pneumophila subsp. pneumophila]AOW59042.1 SAM-dependent methyltransferase TehB [Legionella pneumophila subsp. pneumophila]AOW60769.1 SAM-dependent methyltransferase TehB [Legionella pneumophila subsp. pneumophila]AOW64498.1 SAM-dependent methyltransferase TehB [Legionella pneumophil
MPREYDNLICYKQLSIDDHGKLKFFLEKHSTKEGTWGNLSLNEGEIDFIFQNGLGQELSRIRLDKNNRQLSIPPASWHKIIPISASFDAQLSFYCKPHRYFNKKYGLTEVHRDLLYVYHTYLSHLGLLTTLDVGCGSGRNLLYLAQLGHRLTGIDINQTALENIQIIAQKENLSPLNILSQDLNQPQSLAPDHYDFVYSTVTLQFLNASRIPSLLIEMQEATKKNGYHFLVFPVQSELYSLPSSFTFLPKQQELYHFYQDSGWSILEYKESVGHLHKQDELGRPVQGLFALLLAQKVI